MSLWHARRNRTDNAARGSALWRAALLHPDCLLQEPNHCVTFVGCQRAQVDSSTRFRRNDRALADTAVHDRLCRHKVTRSSVLSRIGRIFGSLKRVVSASGRCGRKSSPNSSSGRESSRKRLSLSGQHQALAPLKHSSDLRRWSEAHGSIRIQEGQPLCRRLPVFLVWSYHSSRMPPYSAGFAADGFSL